MTNFADPCFELAVRAALPQEVLAQPLASLTHLRAAGRGIRRLAGVAALSELRFVDLSDNPISSLVELGANTKLIQLELRGITASSLAGLSGLPDLESVDLRGSQVISVDALSGSPTLRTLELGGCEVRELTTLETLSRLESLSLGDPSPDADIVTPKLDPVRGLSSLRQLRLHGLHIESCALFDELVNLEELVLERCSLGDGLRGLRRLPRLELLSLARCEGIELAALEGQERLSAVILDATKLGSLAPLCSLESLERVSLRGASFAEDNGLERLSAHPRLRELRVNERLVIGR